MNGRKPESNSRIAFMDKKRAILAIAGFAVFVFISCFVITESTQAFDSAICSFVYGHRTAGLTVFFKAVTYMGNWQTITSLCIIAVLIPRTRVTAGIPLSMAAILATLIQDALKVSFHRARPELALHLISQGGYSFPSGHSFTGLIFYGMLVWLCRRNIKNRIAADLITFLLICLIALLGFSRIYLGVHFPTDVLGGWALGLCVLMILIAGKKKLKTILTGKKE